ncbi:MAG: lactate utilization protein [Sarcina sp.]
MDKNVEWFVENKVEKTIKALEKNNMNGYYVKSKDEIINIVETIINKGDKVACGGSMTLFETGIIDYLRKEDYDFLDRYKDGVTQEEVKEIYRGAFSSDAYFTSTNAITKDGYLYNVDGNGNRVAAMMYGPDKVIVICGINKIVNSVEEAIQRNRNIAAPINAKRLNRKTPCATVGHCMDCNSPEKICREYTLIKSQGTKERMHIIFVNENLGY